MSLESSDTVCWGVPPEDYQTPENGHK